MDGTDPVKFLGKIKSAKITKSASVLRTGQAQTSQEVLQRIVVLEEEMRDNELMGEFERELLQERIGALQGGLCILKAGGLSQLEIRETRDRCEDALFATRAALEEGYVPGAGYSLYQAAQKVPMTEIDEVNVGIQVVKKACEAPSYGILMNSMGDHGRAVNLIGT